MSSALVLHGARGGGGLPAPLWRPPPSIRAVVVARGPGASSVTQMTPQTTKSSVLSDRAAFESQQTPPWADLLDHLATLDGEEAQVIGSWSRDELYEQRF